MELCRFCLSGDVTEDNPFLTPCKCAGSIKYVHRYCMREWLSMTTNPDFKVMCQLCRNVYVFPNRYPLELIPRFENDSLWTFLTTPIAPSFGVLYAYHFFLAVFYDHHLFIAVPHSQTYLFLHKYGYDVCVFVLTAMYMSYYKRFAAQIVNRRLYKQHTFVERYTFAFVVSTLVFFMYAAKFPFSKELFGVLLVAFMPRYYDVHIRTLHRINRDARLV